MTNLSQIKCIWSAKPVGRSGWISSNSRKTNQGTSYYGYAHSVTSLAITPDQKYIIRGDSDGNISVLDFLTGDCIKIIEAHQREITGIAITKDSKSIISGCADTNAQVWDIQTGERLRILNPTTDGEDRAWEDPDHWTYRNWRDWVYLLEITISEDGKSVIALTSWFDDAEHHYYFKIWDIKTGELREEKFCMMTDSGCVISSDKKLILLRGSSVHEYFLWDYVYSWETQSFLFAVKEENIGAVAITPDGQFIVTGDSEGTIKIWDIQTRSCQHTFKGHTKFIDSIVITPDGKNIISDGSDDSEGTIKIWDLATKECLQKTELWDLATKERLQKTVQYVSGSPPMLLSPDGHYLVTTDIQSNVKLWALS